MNRKNEVNLFELYQLLFLKDQEIQNRNNTKNTKGIFVRPLKNAEVISIKTARNQNEK